MTLAFIACTEAGNLENQSTLLFRSIRKFGGQFKNMPIHSLQPRRGPTLKTETFQIFDQLEVQHHTEILNTAYEEFPRTNKIFACAWAEEFLPEDILVFLDSDTLFINEPDELLLPQQIGVGIRPVDSKNIASSGPDDCYEPYWQKVYSICQVPEPPYIQTSIDQQTIRACWNSGLVAVQRNLGLFHQWRHHFMTLMRARHFPPVARRPNIGIPFLDQIALSATLARVFERIQMLPYRYNYCLSKRPIMPVPYRNVPLEALVHLHYHQWFNKPDYLAALTPGFNQQSPIYQWITNFLPFRPTIDDPLRC